MTADEYRAAIAELGLSQVKAGKAMGVDPRTSRVWAASGAPPSVGVALAALITIKSLGLDPFAIPSIKAAMGQPKAKKAPSA